MRNWDVDRLLREEQFEELARRGLLPASRTRVRPSKSARIMARVRSLVTPARGAVAGPVTIRHASPADRAAVARLAALEERPAPRGPVLVAEIGDDILAALPLDGTAPVADPLKRTAGLVDLLELRSRQLEGSPIPA